MITDGKVTEIFFIADEFCQKFISIIKRFSIKAPVCKRKYHRDSTMSEAEIMTILIVLTKLKNNMKGALMNVADHILIRKRAIIETINDELKNIAQVEHSGHRAFANFIANTLSAIAAYCFFDKKPAIRDLQVEKDRQLTLF